jgi:predicted transcriptional regulator
MRQKLITLDPTSFEIAQRMPNFSDWVRKQLRSHRDIDQLTLELDSWKRTCENIATQRDELKEQLNGWIKCGEEE